MVITQHSSSPSPSPSLQHSPVPSLSQPASPPHDSTRSLDKKKEPYSTNNEVSATFCSNCGTATTPLWRRAPNGDTICNACGLYLKARNTLRPPSMKRNFKKQDKSMSNTSTTTTTATMATISNNAMSAVVNAANAPGGTCPGGGQCNGTGGSPTCAGCPAFNQQQVNRHAALLMCANCRTTTTPLWRRDEDGNMICNACGLYYKLHHVHRPVSMKRSVIKRRKRIIVTDDGGEQVVKEELEEEEDEADELDSSEEEGTEGDEAKKMKHAKTIVTRKRVVVNHSRKGHEEHGGSTSTSHTASPVPAIEDYIVPKRTTLEEQRQQSYQQQHSTSHAAQRRLPPPPRTPPMNSTIPITSGTSKRFDPLFDYRSNKQSNNPAKHYSNHPSDGRDGSSNDNNNNNNNNPMTLVLPSITTPPLHHHDNNPYKELSEFDQAVTRLERLRRRVPASQTQVLSRLTASLEDIVQQAETILLQHNNTL